MTGDPAQTGTPLALNPLVTLRLDRKLVSDSMTTFPATVAPNAGAFKDTGFLFVAPKVTAAPAGEKAYTTPPPGGPANVVTITSATPTPDQNDLRYTVPASTTVTTLLRKHHLIVLRRLANPYLPPNATTNPYLTVDSQDVRLYDAMRFSTGGVGSPAPHASFGRVHPHAGRQDYITVGAGQDLVLDQTPSTVMPEKATGPGVINPANTFLQHNAKDQAAATAGTSPTLSYPFEWMPYFDRRLVNAAELLHVAAVPSHELTRRFAYPTGAVATARPAFHGQTLGTLITQSANLTTYGYAANPTTPAPLYRALELLTVKPWGFDLPAGGRVPGKININMVWDEAVFQALLDGNDAGGKQNTFSTSDVTTLWTALKTSRTPGFPKPDTTADEDPAGTDRPFKSFGAAQFGPGGAAGAAAGTGRADTLLRDGATPGTPLLFNATPKDLAGTAQNHPYTQAEPLRKLLNNVTTTTDTFLLVYTVGFFEVRGGTANDPNDPVVLGKEAFDQVPGDLRAQYAAVLDRSLLTTRPVPAGTVPWVGELANKLTNVTTTPGVPNPSPIPLTLFGTLTGPATVTGQYQGKTWTIVDGTQLAVSAHGQEAALKATAAAPWTADAATGRVTIQVAVQGSTTGSFRDPSAGEFPAGALLTNLPPSNDPATDVRFGYTPAVPGPSLTIDPKNPPPSVLLFGRLTP